jgi:hypothetical protein
MNLFSYARRMIFGISLEEVVVVRRGFHRSNSSTTNHLERIGIAFLGGYHAALEEPSIASLSLRIDKTSSLELCGFAYEGAAMALVLLDEFRLGPRAFPAFLKGPGLPHAYMLHIGAGWALARLPWLRLRLPAVLGSFDPVLRWLVLDGYGFHEGYFHWSTAVRCQTVPRGVSGYAVRAFDQGLGRSLWFVEGIDPERISSSISRFPEQRRGDLWAGVGLACAYAGGADSAALARLSRLAGEYAGAAAQGSVFAAEARRRAGNPVSHCDLACRMLAGMSADDAATLACESMLQLPPDDITPCYEIWRTRIQRHFVHTPRGASL